jgi:hypothetical protein
MQLTEKQKIEKKYFDLFSKHYELPLGTVEHGDKPDVVILGENNQSTLGIEIALLYIKDGDVKDSEQLQSVNRLKVIDSAEEIYLSRGGRKIALYVGFCELNLIKPKRIKQIAKDLASYALEISTLSDGYLSCWPLDATPEIGYLSHDGNEYPKCRWELSQTFRTPLLSVTRVKDVVARKAAKAQQYAPCEATWLLLVVEFWDPAQDQLIYWPADESVGETPFDRILIYKTGFTEVIEVRQ